MVTMKKLELNNAGIHTHLHHSKTSPFNRSWLMIVMIAVIAFALILWMTGARHNPSSIPQRSILEETNVQGSSLPVREFPGFISEAKASDLPKTFSSEYINFESGSAVLVQGAEDELDQITHSLEESPFATIRIEGFSDQQGDLTQMKDLSFRRALAVKEQLVARGINPDRIDTVGNVSDTQRVVIVVTSVE
jgi:outer membrane protein OmpA-like peptidoglycan-associated protein